MIKKINFKLISIIVLSLIFDVATAIAIPVFPGAEGFGAETIAGRGGEVIIVSNLNEEGPGSLRRALQQKGPRIVLFEVGGVIELTSDIEIKNPYLTLAGQTAPPPGITLKGAGIKITTHDVLIQHIRIRVGDEKIGPNYINRDALQIIGPNSNNIVVDHCSLSWSVDENISTYYKVKNITLSNNIISEALDSPLHPKGNHSMGILFGKDGEKISLIKNIVAHNAYRNPRIAEGVTASVVNNVFYNGRGFCSIGKKGKRESKVDFIGNLFLRGPDTQKNHAIAVQEQALSSVFLKNNLFDGGKVLRKSSDKFRQNQPVVPLSNIKYINNNVLLKTLSKTSGARPCDRDSVDERVVNGIRSNQGKIVRSQRDVGGWVKKENTLRKIKIPTNPNCDDDANGYTNIEEMLFIMSIELEKGCSI